MNESQSPVDHSAVKEIVLISAPRSGTNFFCECLDAYPEVMGLYEIFNPAGAFGAGRGNQLEILNEVTGLNAESASDEAVVQLFRRTPEAALEAMAEVAARTGRSAFSYKVFPKQLDGAVLRDLLAAENRHVLILTRSRLDVFVSYEKARQSKTWKNTDTSGMKPDIQVDEFLTWAEGNDAWFEDVADQLDELGKSYRVLSYERDVDMPKEDLVEQLRATLEADGIAVTVPSRKPGARFKRQDVRAEPFAKIANGDQLRDALKAADRLEYALGQPLTSRQAPQGHVAG